MVHFNKSEWAILIGLLFLSLVPCVGGMFRLMELGTGASVIPENPRVLAAPLPVVFHILGSVPYCVLGILQFLPNFRTAYPSWHRRAGRLLVVAGLVAALSGLWMTHFYDFPEVLQGTLLYVVRLFVGFGMVASIVLGLSAIIKKHIAQHKAWMIRAYALGQGAGTQSLIMIPWMLTLGEPSGLMRDLLMTLAWAINLFVAQAAICASLKGTSHTDTRLLSTTFEAQK